MQGAGGGDWFKAAPTLDRVTDPMGRVTRSLYQAGGEAMMLPTGQPFNPDPLDLFGGQWAKAVRANFSNLIAVVAPSGYLPGSQELGTYENETAGGYAPSVYIEYDPMGRARRGYEGDGGGPFSLSDTGIVNNVWPCQPADPTDCQPYDEATGLPVPLNCPSCWYTEYFAGPYYGALRDPYHPTPAGTGAQGDTVEAQSYFDRLGRPGPG